MSAILLTGPTSEPVTVSEAKRAARIEHTAFDADIPDLIKSARELIEHETGHVLLPQVWRFEFTDWPAVDEQFELAPIASVAVYSWSGLAWVLVDPLLYSFQYDELGWFIGPPLGSSVLPTLGEAVYGAARVRVDVTAGHATAAAVPASAKTYIKAQVAYWLRNVEAASERPIIVTPMLARLLDPIRTWR